MTKLIIVGVSALALAACAPAPTSTEPTSPTTGSNAVEPMAETDSMQSIAEVVATNPEFSTLLQAVTAADLVEVFAEAGPFTVFAPTNAAFAKLPAATLEAVLADKEQLTSILQYHVVSGEVPAAAVASLSSAQTLQGSDVAISVEGETVMVNNATVTQTDINASNGIIHVIDTVLIPE